MNGSVDMGTEIECPAESTDLEHGGAVCPACEYPGIAEGPYYRCPRVSECEIESFDSDAGAVRSPDGVPAAAARPGCGEVGKLHQLIDEDWMIACSSDECRAAFYFADTPAGWMGHDTMLAEAIVNAGGGDA